MITVYGRADSTNVQKVLWLFDELGIAFERIDRGGKFGGLDDPDYLAMNPNARIPTVVDGDLVMWESNAILRHYAREHPEAGLFPASPAEMLRADMMLDWNTTTLWSALRPAYWGTRVEGRPQSDEDIAASIALTRATLGTFDGLMSGADHAAGEAFTIADIPLAITLNRWLAMGFDLAAHPAAAAWNERVSARPAYQARVYSR